MDKLIPNIYQNGIEESTSFYTNMVVSNFYQGGKPRRMKNVRSNNIEMMRKMAGLTREELAAQLGTTATTVYRKERGDRQLRLEELQDYARILNCRPEDLVSSIDLQIPVVGYVGAGAKVHSLEETIGSMEMVSPPTGIYESDIKALRIEGEGLPPFENGWLLFYKANQNGVSPECYNKLSVIMLVDNTMVIKKPSPGSKPGLYHLLYRDANPVLDAEVKWASKVIDIRPS